jgi:hypothetical protein
MRGLERTVSLGVFALLAGCTSAGTTPAPLPTGTSCTALSAQCADSQLGCVEAGGQASCEACGAGTFPSSAGTCDALEGTALTHSFPDVTAQAGEEFLWHCRSWTLDNDAEIWVNAVELSQTEDSHHSNWVYVPDTVYAGDDGIWPCGDRGYDFYQGVAAGGLLYAQSTQAAHEVQKFPTGTAIRVPPHARIVSDIHVLNTSSQAITGHADLTLYTLPVDQVETRLTSFHIEYDALDIPAHASSRFTGQCAVGPDVAKATGKPFAPKVYYLLPHTHTLATGFFAEILGGPSDGKSLLDLGSYNGEAHGRSFDPPIDMAGSDGFRFACQYLNPGSDNIGWGVGKLEMCEMFGFADSTSFFQSRVGTGAAAGADGDVLLFEGPCTTEVFAESK